MASKVGLVVLQGNQCRACLRKRARLSFQPFGKSGCVFRFVSCFWATLPTYCMLPGVPPIMNEGLLPESAACLAADMRWLAYSIHGRKLGDFIIIEMVGNWGCVPNHGESCSNPGNPRFEPTSFFTAQLLAGLQVELDRFLSDHGGCGARQGRR